MGWLRFTNNVKRKKDCSWSFWMGIMNRSGLDQDMPGGRVGLPNSVCIPAAFHSLNQSMGDQMFKKHSISRIGNSLLLVFVSLILLLNLNELRSNAFKIPDSLPEDMLGSSYLPEDDSKRITSLPKDQRMLYTEKPYFLPGGLSDWERLRHLEEHKIESIRILIPECADVTIKDPKDCQKFSIALQPRYILRKVASDVGRSHGGYGAGASLGVMKVRYQGVKKPLIIGIAQIGFYLDVWHGNNRQEFYSKALSVAVDHAIKKYSDYQIPKEHLARQSGIDFLTLPDELKDL
ncbi:MAG TPA: hypothetical protein DCM07_24390 [Planctomycetaceae bacterium]|nr:hypothetical protein [Gimesia sp.]HAH47935.1 hypothetical protein [Planctomycetaceae bacterium]HBL42714.1 hypothetical protein [Planctomycetaceae bacterium]